METYLSRSELHSALQDHDGLIPVGLDAKKRRIKWMDLEGYHFYEGFFHKSLNMFAALKTRSSALETFTTGFDVLEDEEILTDNIYPTGFIFHAGRSGSTLLAKALARSRKNLILSEHSAHNNFWLAITINGEKKVEISEKNLRLYKNLLLATARRRLDSHQNCFIKFTSYNIFFYDFIRHAFPEVPAVFLHREVSEVLSSINKKPLKWMTIKEAPARELLTGVSQEEFAGLIYEDYRSKVLANLLSAGFSAEGNLLRCLDSKNLKPENFPSILDFFNVGFNKNETDMMKSQFNYYSKAENKLVRFTG